jgi:HD-GYP domain-containing protein (c-di-GMP phosphodiesterase class II)
MALSAGSAQDQHYRKLIDLGIALSAEHDHNRLMEMILLEAKAMCNADGGTLYLMTDDRRGLRFEIMRNDTLNIAMGGTTGKPIPFPPLKVYLDDGTPNHNNVSTHVALVGEMVDIADAYDVKDFDFSGTKKFDAGTGYRSKSFLTVPLKNHQNDVIGVLQLINSRSPAGEVTAFSPDIQPLIEALASQAAVALENQHLIEAQKKLFTSFIHVIAGAIDAKSPYTGGHCNRVPVLTRLLAEAACAESEGVFKDYKLEGEEWYELEVAAGLHDCGKVTTPEYVVDKATKLETIYNRVHEIRTRFEVVKRDRVISYLEALIKNERDPETLKVELEEQLAQLNDDFAFVAECNVGGEFMAPEKIERLKSIAQLTWTRTLDNRLGISRDEERYLPKEPDPVPSKEFLLVDRPEHLIPHDVQELEDSGEFKLKRPQWKFNRGEVYNLSIGRGTLTNEDRFHINDHIIQTIRMLKALPFPKNLRRVEEFAGGHHEKMDGTGYPKGLKCEEMSTTARMMALADIFEALTAADRPYKAPKTLSESVKIMSFMVKDKHIDPELFELFLRSGVYKRYAEEYMKPEQLDEVDISKYLPKKEEPPKEEAAKA